MVINHKSATTIVIIILSLLYVCLAKIDDYQLLSLDSSDKRIECVLQKVYNHYLLNNPIHKNKIQLYKLRIHKLTTELETHYRVIFASHNIITRDITIFSYILTMYTYSAQPLDSLNIKTVGFAKKHSDIEIYDPIYQDINESLIDYIDNENNSDHICYLISIQRFEVKLRNIEFYLVKAGIKQKNNICSHRYFITIKEAYQYYTLTELNKDIIKME